MSGEEPATVTAVRIASGHRRRQSSQTTRTPTTTCHARAEPESLSTRASRVRCCGGGSVVNGRYDIAYSLDLVLRTRSVQPRPKEDPRSGDAAEALLNDVPRPALRRAGYCAA
ncbi:hypothetical protein GCM10009740_12170 [Terrabacter terrae]|uniref:Uncharacterized protein n=1 Tax=Terrabacter terrae TaxID=318434 RepID=A0ABN2TYE2_9MICO